MKPCLYLIIVFYNPDAKQIAKTEKLASMYKTIVIDNSDKVISGDHSFFYIPLLLNRGIAYAQNIGIEHAIKRGATHLLFFDQDSDVDICYPEQILESYLLLAQKEYNLAVLGPLFIDSRTNAPYIHVNCEGERYVQVRELISSGLIISTEVISKIGLLDDGLFIDYVDFEWCWRASSFGYISVIDTQMKIVHSVGYDFKQILGLKFYLSSPIRYYYQYRNFLVLLKRNYVPRLWKFKQVVRKMIDVFIVPALAKETKSTYYYIFRGIKDGIIGKKGIYE